MLSRVALYRRKNLTATAVRALTTSTQLQTAAAQPAAKRPRGSEAELVAPRKPRVMSDDAKGLYETLRRHDCGRPRPASFASAAVATAGPGMMLFN